MTMTSAINISMTMNLKLIHILSSKKQGNTKISQNQDFGFINTWIASLPISTQIKTNLHQN